MSRFADNMRLILTDDRPASWMPDVLKGSVDASRWEILPLGYGHEHYQEEHRRELDQLPAWSMVDVSSIVSRARSLVREFVPQLMLDLRKRPLEGGKSLSEILQERGFNAWWLLEISEKSAYRGSLINRLYYLALIREVVNQGAYKEVWICLKDRLLAEAVAEAFKEQKVPCVRLGAKPPGRIRSMLSGFARYVKHAVGIAAQHCAQILILRSLRIAESTHPVSTDLLLFSFYPRMWAAPYSEHATEWFFGSLPEHFPKEHAVRYAIWLTASPWELWKRRREIRAFIRGRSAVCLTLAAGFGDAASLLSSRWWLIQVRLALNWQPRLNFSFLGFGISAIVAGELRRSLSSTELFRDLLMYQAWTNLARAVAPVAVLYRLEFQPFENAIIYGTKGWARTIAFQHSLFGENYLPYFSVQGEFKSDSGRWGRPLPDLILTSGVFGREVMLRNGCRTEMVEVCGPVRYRPLIAQHAAQSGRPDRIYLRLGLDVRTKVLVVATAVSREEAMGLLIALGKCAAELGQWFVAFKSHPALSLEHEFVRLVGVNLGSSRYRILESLEELYDSLSVAQAVVLNHSTVTFESLMLGVLPIVFDSGAVFDPKAMEPHEWEGVSARNAEELRVALRKTTRMNGEAQPMKERLLTQAGRWFDRPDHDPYQRFIDILQKHGVLNAQVAGQR